MGDHSGALPLLLAVHWQFWVGAMDVTKPYTFIGFGAIDVTKPYKSIGFRAIDFRIPSCNEMALELVCGADFWCNRHCRRSPVVLEGFWGQVWPKIARKPEKKHNSELLMNR